MPFRSSAVVIAIAVLFATGALVAQADLSKLKDPAQLSERAPDLFRARFDTSQGPFVIAVEREWAPLAADRFYNLVKNGFYNETRFFRVLDGFMVQFGLHADPDVQSAWRSANLKDEPVTKSNTRGFVSFTRESSPNSRYTMIFINYKDNSYLDADGFSPFGQVVSGMEIVDRLYSGYGASERPGSASHSSRRQCLSARRISEARLRQDRDDRGGAVRDEVELRAVYVAGGESVSGNPSTLRTNSSSGSAPRISVLPLTIVLGTPVTRNFRERSMNSVASTEVARMCVLSPAILCASDTARGQCGQVGVTKTWMSSGPVACAEMRSRCRPSAANRLCRREPPLR